LLSGKTIIYGANVDEDSLLEENEFVKIVKNHAKEVGAEVVTLCAKIEEELVGLEEDEAEEFLTELGVNESGLSKIIHTAFAKLNLISYFTAGVKEVRAWTITKGWKAPKSASVIHNDFEKGFIRAEVIGYDDFIANKGEHGAKEAGKMRLEGKDYEVQDGDVMHFRFNV
jgi:ribosome-binding ATPase YchF (GTP1/OBG family)